MTPTVLLSRRAVDRPDVAGFGIRSLGHNLVGNVDTAHVLVPPGVTGDLLGTAANPIRTRRIKGKSIKA